MNRTLIVACVVLCLVLAASAEIKSRRQWNFNGKAKSGVLEQRGNGYAPCDQKVKQYSGYFNIDAATDKHYFFWAFESRSNPSTDPVILWMTGGPGCSGSLAILMENGPCHIHESNNQIYSNPYSWNNNATVIYIDQPADVGFSYSNQQGMDSNETQVGDDMYNFLQAFFAAYPQFQQNEFFVSGESYGGHFAPATAHRVWKGNRDQDGTKINLKGVSIGNGLTVPQVQYQYYGELAYNWCKNVTGEPCVSKSTYDAMQAAIPQCIKLTNECNSFDLSKCPAAQAYCNQAMLMPYQETGKNVYNIKIPCAGGSLCYNTTRDTAFMNNEQVQQSLGVKPTKWSSCNFEVNSMFSYDWSRNFGQLIPDMLESGIRVLVYNGDLDFVCNWLGGKAWTKSIMWAGQADFWKAPLAAWNGEDGQPMAWARSVGGFYSNSPIEFTFMRVRNAGHLVPMDQPETASKMINNFIFDKKFEN